MKKISLLTLVLFIIIASVLTSCGEDTTNKEDVTLDEKSNEKVEEKSDKEINLTISAAASLTDVMEELKEIYIKENPNISIDYTFDSSGTLQAQIEEGAPVDIFFSAAEKQMDALEEKDLILKDSRKSMLVNKVVLIAPKDNEHNIKSLDELKNDDVKKIAVGDPEYVPVGQYTEEIFENLKIKDDIKDKLVLGNNVRTVLTWTENKDVDYGLVYATDAYTSDNVEIVLEAPEDLYKKVSYPVGIIENSKNKDEAKSFLEFLANEDSKKIFESYGFYVE